ILPAEERAVADVGDKMLRGTLDDLEPGEWRIILGVSLAQALAVDIGDKVVLMVPQATVTPAGVWPRHRAFTVTGVFEVGMFEYDRSLAFVHLADGARLFGLGEAVSGVRLKMADMMRAPWVVREVAETLPGIYYV